MEHQISLYVLIGLALENLLKAICIKKNPFLVTNGKLKKWAEVSHDLHDIAKQAEICLSEDELFLVERLTEFIRWAGRYPIPMRFEDEMPRILPDGGAALLNFMILRKDILVFNDLFGRCINSVGEK